MPGGKGTINITGSTIRGTDVIIAIDANVNIARKVLQDRGMEDLAKELEKLVTAVKGHSSETGRPDVVEAQTAAVAAELTKPKPDRSLIRIALESITAAAGSAGAIAAAVKAFQAVL